MCRETIILPYSGVKKELPFTGKCEKRRRKRETCERSWGRGNKEENAEEKGVVIGNSVDNIGKKKKIEHERSYL
jgi:hypothetical protein